MEFYIGQEITVNGRAATVTKGGVMIDNNVRVFERDEDGATVFIFPKRADVEGVKRIEKLIGSTGRYVTRDGRIALVVKPK